jgi:aminopeptidase
VGESDREAERRQRRQPHHERASRRTHDQPRAFARCSSQRRVRGQLESDEGAARLGEVALVDRHSRVGELNTIFFDGLFDENATAHIAYGFGLPAGLEPGADGGNVAETHTDFMIGSADVGVDGIGRDDTATPVLRGGDWVLS